MTRPGRDIVNKDGSISPEQDTGFRMLPVEPVAYIRRKNPVTIKLWGIDSVHSDDIVNVESTGIWGINYITLNLKKITARAVADIRRNILTRLKAEGGKPSWQSNLK